MRHTKKILTICLMLVVLTSFFTMITSAALYEYNDVTNGWEYGIRKQNVFAQTFLVGNVGPNEDFMITDVSWYCQRNGYTGPVTCTLRDVVNGLPTEGPELATAVRSEASLPETSLAWQNWTFDTSYRCHAGEMYAVVMSAPGAAPAVLNALKLYGQCCSNVYPIGEACRHDPGFWMTFSDGGDAEDFCFRIYGTPNPNDAPIVENPDPPHQMQCYWPYNIVEFSCDISDYDGDTMSWTISTSPDIGSDSGSDTDTQISCALSGATWSTTYTVSVAVTDGTEWTNESYWFKTRPSSGTCDISTGSNSPGSRIAPRPPGADPTPHATDETGSTGSASAPSQQVPGFETILTFIAIGVALIVMRRKKKI